MKPQDWKKKSQPANSAISCNANWNCCPGEIESLENQIAELETTLSHADFYLQEADKVAITVQQMEKLQQDLEQKMQRWMELEGE